MASDPVRLEVEGDVGFLVIDNPPVNALSRAVVAGLAEQLELAVRHDGIRAVVIICAGGTFAAGADISEFGVEPGPRPLPDLPRRIEDCRKPVIAALHGTAFGGGLELALACHYRIARADTRLGFPEVRLGLLPGAGGTQWLPRIVGAERALAIMLGGKPIAGVDAKQMGLLDDIAEGELRHDAAALAARVLAAGAARPRVRDRAVAPGSVPPGLFEADRARAPRNRPGQFAPARIIDCVEAAITMPFDEGLALERRLFAECLQSRESEALRHIFFAEREAARLPDVPRDTPVRNITRVGIVGAGTMGGGIAMALAGAGIRVWLQDIDQGSLHRGMAAIRRNYEVSQRKGRLSAAELEVTLGRIEPTPDLAALADADLVIEAAYENMAVKQQVFTTLDRVCRPGAILATNTSTLDVDEIARATTRPRDVIGLHFFSPANVMRLLEVVRGAATAPDVLATCMQLARRIGKVAVVSGVCPGFIGNRMLGGYGREAALLVLEGASPARVDRALTDFGMAMGPMAVGDLAGLDIGVRAADEARAAGRGSPDPRSGALARRLVAMGRMGLKAGKGLYRYEPGSRSPLPDPEVESLIREEAVRLNVPQREASDEEIVARCIYPLINEACFILEEGIALRPGDIDVVWTSGYGFPAYRGGPLFHADTIGVRHVFDAICRFGDRDGDPYGYWRPAPLLAALARDGRSFADLGDARSHHG